MVISHERSGTHFLINALTRAYDYPERFLDFDQSSLNINYFAPQTIASTVAELAKRRSSVERVHLRELQKAALVRRGRKCCVSPVSMR